MTTFFLAVLFSFALLLVTTLKLMLISQEVSASFRQACASLVTTIRLDHYDAITETAPDRIEERMQSPERAEYRAALLAELSDWLRKDLSLQRVGEKLAKTGKDGEVLYELERLLFSYSNGICTLSCNLRLPIRILGAPVSPYLKSLEVQYALAYK